jgi:hypothetical protein
MPASKTETGLLGTPQRKRAFAAAACALLFLWGISSWNSGTPVLVSKAGSSSTASLSLVSEVSANCSRVMNEQKSLLFNTFSDVFEGVRNIALISMPDHQNKVSTSIF